MIFDMILGLHNRERIVSSTNDVRKPGYKINEIRIKDLDIRPKTLKLLEKNIGEKLQNIGFFIDFFGCDTKRSGNKSKNIHIELYPTETFFISKDRKDFFHKNKYVQNIYLMRE